jgi:aminopeptidase N
MKFEGLETDGHSSTHPVRNDVASLAETESIFDGISYGKGAAYLKQIIKVFGRESLSRALATFFKKHQWQNPEYKDLIECFENEFKVKMNQTMSKNLTFTEWSN